MAPRVLCIDNRDANLKAERLVLERAGYRVFTAATIEWASEILQNEFVDLVLVSDDIAPNDHDLCSQLRRLAPSARIVLQRTSFDRDSFPPDADMILPKTINPREKLNHLARLVMPRAA